MERTIKNLRVLSFLLILSITFSSCEKSTESSSTASQSTGDSVSPFPNTDPVEQELPKEVEQERQLEKELTEVVDITKSSKLKEKLKAQSAVLPIQNIKFEDSCELINNLELKNKRQHLVSKYGHYNIFATKNKSSYKNFTVKNLSKNYFETLPFRAKINAKALQVKLARNAISEVLINQRNYMGIVKVPDLVDDMYDLKTCLAENSNYKTMATNAKIFNNKSDEKLYEAFIIDNLIQSFKLRILFLRVEEIKKQIAHETNLLQKDPYFEDPEYFGSYDSDQVEKIKEKYLPALEEAQVPIEAMMQAAPMLLTTENKFSITNWNNLKIVESKVMKNLLKGFSKELILEMKSAFKKDPSINSFKKVILDEDNQALLDSFAKTKIQDKRLRALITQKLTVFINEANKGAYYMCENEGENLHHNSNLVKLTLDKNVNDNNYENTMSRDHSGYCYLKKNNPIEDIDSFTWKTGLGLSMIGVGAGIQIFIGPGTVLGIGLVASGGTLVTGETAVNSFISRSQEMEGKALHFNGWSDYRDVIKLTEGTTDLYSDVGTDAILSLVGASAGKIIASTGKSRKISDEELLKGFDEFASTVKGFERGNINQKLIENGSEQAIKSYKELIWKRHEVMWEEYIKSTNRYKTIAKRDWYRVRNGNDIPAYHMYGKSGEETYALLDIVADGKRLKTDEGEEALEQINKWILNYETYIDDIDSGVDAGFQAIKQTPELIKKIKKYSAKDFYNGKSQKITLTSVKNGKIVETEKTFESYYELDQYLRKQKKLSASSFARNSLEEITNKSDLYKVMDAQAIDYRKLEFLRDTLKKVNGRSEVQEKLLKDTLKLLADKNLRPRPDALKRLQKLELRAERLDFVRGLKSKEKLMDKMHFKLSEVASDKAKETGAVGRYFKTILAVGATSIGSGVTARYLTTGGSIDEITSKISIAYNNVYRSFNNGFTGDEKDCAEAPRSFSFNLCFHKLVKTEIGVERARAIVSDDSYSFRNDPIVIRKTFDLTYRMLKLRKKLRGAEIFILASELLKETYDIHTKREIIELMEKVSIGKKNIGAKVAQILNAESEEEAQGLLTKFEKELGVDFTDSLKYILIERESIVSSIKNSARLPQNLEQMIRGLDVEEAEKIIQDEDFFDYTVQMIETAQEQF